jgi:hypothetical protein
MNDQKGDSMPDRELSEDRRQGLIDRWLKRAMPNGTVMRRYIAGAFIIGTVFGVVGIRLIDKTDAQATAGSKAICAIINWSEETLATSPNARNNDAATLRFKGLIRDMRATGVDCPPPPNR